MARTSRPNPKTPAELAECLADPAMAARAFGGNASDWAEFQSTYAEAAGLADPSIDQQVAEQTQRVLAQWLRDGGSAVAERRLNLAGAAPSSSAPGAAADALFRPEDKEHLAGKFFAAVSPKSRNPELAQKLRVENFGSTVPSEGGFLVPETLRAEILTTSLEMSIVRPRATVIPMSTARVPVPTVDETTHNGSVFGGLTGSWVEEGASFVADDASFGRAVLDAKKLGIYCEAPNELVNDAPAFTAFLQRALPSATSFYEDLAFLTGSGVGEPLGVLEGSAKVAVTRATASTVKLPDIANMFARMLPGSLGSAVWVCSPEVIPQLLQLALTVAAGDSVSPPLWLTAGSVANGPAFNLLGRPLLVSEKVPQLGSAGDLSFLDLGYYLIGDRQEMTLTSSEHVKFQQDKTAYRIIERADGRPWLSSAITPANGGDTLSPIVTLAA